MKTKLLALSAVVFGLWGVGAGAALPESHPAGAEDEMLGGLDAALTFCGKTDVKHQVTYERYRNEMIGVGQGDEALMIPASKTPGYQRARHAMNEKLEAAAMPEVLAQCRRMVGAEQ